MGISQTVQAGEIRVGGGITQWEHILDTDYTIIEVGYDYDHIFGFTFNYGIPEYDWAPNRVQAAVEFGYEFGEEATVRPYGSLGGIHVRGGYASLSSSGDIEGSTSLALGVGVRAAYKFLYINAAYYYNFSNDNNIAPGDEDGKEVDVWPWDNHSAINLISVVVIP